MQKFIKDIKFKDIKNIQINRILTFISLPFDVSNLDKSQLKNQRFSMRFIVILTIKLLIKKISNLEFVTISLAVEKGE